jgi:hypothetical protein
MCYRDRAYCAGPCAYVKCARQITDAVTAAAERAGLPLAVMDLRDGCRSYRPPPAPAPIPEAPAPGHPDSAATKEE